MYMLSLSSGQLFRETFRSKPRKIEAIIGLPLDVPCHKCYTDSIAITTLHYYTQLALIHFLTPITSAPNTLQHQAQTQLSQVLQLKGFKYNCCQKSKGLSTLVHECELNAYSIRFDAHLSVHMTCTFRADTH